MLTPLVFVSVDQMGLQWVPIPYPSGGWQPSSQVSISFLLHETALFTQKGAFWIPVFWARTQENTPDTLALVYLKR